MLLLSVYKRTLNLSLYVTIIVMKKFLLFSFVFIFLLVPTGFIFGQFNTPMQTQVDLSLSPETPGANQYVTATADSYGTDLNAASFSWYINGKLIKSGKGLKTFSFTTGATNTSTVLGLNITTQEGERVTKTITLKPSEVDLIWQSYGYVPPFYKGKTLFSHQDMIQFIAIPHIIGTNGVEIPAGNLIYKWTRNGTILGDFSGYGKNTYTMISSVISRPLLIDVEVTSPTTDDMAQASTVATPIEPSVVFYEKNPLYGIQFQKALTGSVAMSDAKEINVLAEPFYFGVNYLSDPSLSYKWNINNSQIDSDTTKTNRIFRPVGGTAGTSYISLSIENANKMLQYANNGFNLNFNNTK